ncbi:uncharacterized protein LOC109706701 isoform X2 [Ananas comosus]|uniref:Uncharacterized protein LOC109706701 isoform X2 n=1 Tax=Ananas comosus TaxID=4615 RepID=A0A6P5EIK6_ANACO|nr:uncharacterized protein LOC109706701 isoform X2 [Ananas comosus]
MDTRVRTALRSMRAAPEHDKEMEKERTSEMQGNRFADSGNGPNRNQSRREKKIALQQDVDKLRKKLRHEENVHRALERAFTRPLGALPRLPPYLPSYTLELLAEVAVLEEEVVRLEEQVVNFRQGLYQEAIYIASSKKTKEGALDLCNNRCPQLKPCAQLLNYDGTPNGASSNRLANGKQTPRKQSLYSSSHDDRQGKENQLSTNLTRNCKQSPTKKVSKPECAVADKRCSENSNLNNSDEKQSDDSSGPNKLSEEILRCLISIFAQMSSTESTEEEMGTSPSVSGSCESSENVDMRDPYGILELGRRDIGPYNHFRVIEASSVNSNLVTSSSMLHRRLKALLKKLASVDLLGLTHQQKLAFWINIYNSCMMNAFLDQGLPASPQMLVALMPKATINVGGHLLSAMAIEHFILRSPYHLKNACPKGMKSDDMTMRGILGLEWPEPLVTFALSCGSWSSPAVRVYTAFQVEKQLETAKREYLQAAVATSMPNKLAIPKLLDWYLLDFAKDLESLMDWICLQLPSELRDSAVKCLEMSRRGVVPHPIQVLPYEFRFRYILAP